MLCQILFYHSVRVCSHCIFCARIGHILSAQNASNYAPIMAKNASIDYNKKYAYAYFTRAYRKNAAPISKKGQVLLCVHYVSKNASINRTYFFYTFFLHAENASNTIWHF